MEFNELLNTRRCIRAYTDKPVTAEQIQALLEAAVKAPNACNYQSWHFYVVCDKEKINAFHPDVANIPWIENISLLIVVCLKESVAETLQKKFGEQQGRMFAYQDTAGAVNHILLKAADMGLGGCWIGPMRTDGCKCHIAADSDHTPVAILTIGTPAENVPKRRRKPLSEVYTVVGELPDGSAIVSDDGEKPFTLAHASLPEARFDDLNLGDAKFTNINLHGAKFSDINLSDVEITECYIDGMTVDGVNVKDAIEKAKE